MDTIFFFFWNLCLNSAFLYLWLTSQKPGSWVPLPKINYKMEKRALLLYKFLKFKTFLNYAVAVNYSFGQKKPKQ